MLYVELCHMVDGSSQVESSPRKGKVDGFESFFCADGDCSSRNDASGWAVQPETSMFIACSRTISIPPHARYSLPNSLLFWQQS